MKTKAVPVFLGALLCIVAGGLAGCASEPAAPPVANTAQPVTPTVDPPLPVTPGPNAVASAAVASTNAPIAIVAPQRPALPPGVDPVVDMAQAHVGDAVLLEYINSSPNAYQLNADEILYLRDLGLSETVISAMLRHGNELRTSGVPAGPPPAAESAASTNSAAVEAAPPVYAAPVTAPAAVDTMSAPPPTMVEPPAVTYSSYYDALAPYGSWVSLPAYGWCWQPTCAVVDPGWQPYCQDGQWLWTSSGWYWQSDYSWGWAPFHYGRWYCNPACGWVWVPGSVWGPAWVTWRTYGDYCGWAPLPPEACWTAGVGLTWYGSPVSVGFGFGLGWNCYSFVNYHDFCGPRPYHHLVPRHEVPGLYGHSTVINDYAMNNHTVVNRGLAPSRISAVTRQEIRTVQLRDLPPRAGGPQPTAFPRRSGNDLAVYRPTIPPDARPMPPAQALRHSAERAPTSGIVAHQPMPSRRVTGPAGTSWSYPNSPARYSTPTFSSRGEVSRGSNFTAPTTSPRSSAYTAPVRSDPTPRYYSNNQTSRGELRKFELPSSGYTSPKFANTQPTTRNYYQQPVTTPRAPAYQQPARPVYSAPVRSAEPSYSAPQRSSAPMAPAYTAPSLPSATAPRANAGPAPSRGGDSSRLR